VCDSEKSRIDFDHLIPVKHLPSLPRLADLTRHTSFKEIAIVALVLYHSPPCTM
jgi:hypothetical protein